MHIYVYIYIYIYIYIWFTIRLWGFLGYVKQDPYAFWRLPVPTTVLAFSFAELDVRDQDLTLLRAYGLEFRVRAWYLQDSCSVILGSPPQST